MSNHKDSPYDDAGMPLATTLANYDTVEERRLGSVKQKVDPFAEARLVVPLDNPTNLIDNDYEEKKLPDSITHRNIDHKKFNSAIYEGVNVPGRDEIKVVDVEDPAVRKELLVKEAEDKGFKETQELPKTEKKETVEAVKKEAVKNSDADDFESLVNDSKTTPGEKKK